MMDETSVHPSVAVLEWVHVDETKCCRRGLQHWVDIAFPHSAIGLQKRKTKILHVLRTSSNELRYGNAQMISFPKKYAIRPESGEHKARVLDQHPEQPNQLPDCQLILSSLQYSLSPALQPGSGSSLSLDLKTCLTIGQEQKARRSRYQTRSGMANRFCGTACQVLFGERFEDFGSSNYWAPAACSQQVVAYFVAPGQFGLCSEVNFRIQSINRCQVPGIIDFQRLTHQEFIEEPCSSRMHPGR